MNYVAHQVLSFNNENHQIGNLLGEVIKGNKHLDFQPEIQKGIFLHRFIDSYTDEHSITKECTSYFHPTHGKYAPIIIDVVFDYLLIKNWDQYVSVDFETFKQNCYQLFQKHETIYPPKLKEILFYLLKYDWFHNYSTLDGIEATLRNIGKRTKFENNLDNTRLPIENHLEQLENHFHHFFPQIEDNCKNFLLESL